MSEEDPDPVQPSLSHNFKTWDVKLLWIATFPSIIFNPGEVESKTIELYGIDRSSVNITRPLTRISSLEQYNQGYIDGVPDIRVTIFTKEAGAEFEDMRRLAATKIPFDISLILASDSEEELFEDNPHEGIWIEGYEEFLGCRVTGERTNYAIADFPVREFEIMALRHQIAETDDFEAMIEGDGTYASHWPEQSEETPEA